MNRVLGVLAIVLFLAVLLAWTFFPDIPSSVLGWTVLFVVGIPAYIFVEWLGEVVLDSQFFKSRSRFTRILIGVPVVLVLISITFIVIMFVQ